MFFSTPPMTLNFAIFLSMGRTMNWKDKQIALRKKEDARWEQKTQNATNQFLHWMKTHYITDNKKPYYKQ